MFIQNPELDLMVAPKGNYYHCMYQKIDCLKYIILREKNIYDLNDTYNKIKKILEEDTFANFQNNLKYIKNNFKTVDYIGEENYYVNYLENEQNKTFQIAVMCVFEDIEEVFELNQIKEIKKIKVSEYDFEKIKTHSSEPILTGNINTNNKLTEFLWKIDNEGLFENIYYEVSLWKDNKLIKIYNTTNDSFILAEHALEQNDGTFELIVTAKDSYDSSSKPASYIFYLKTDISDDFKILMKNEFDEEINVTNLNSPTFEILPYEDGFDYKIYLDNSEFSYLESIKEDKEYFKIDTARNSLLFYCPLILQEGRYLLNIEKVDDVGNKTGSFINPNGKYGRTFFSFIVSNELPPTPELIDYYWISNTRCFLNFKSNENAKTFRIYQNTFLIKEIFDSYTEVTPIIESEKDLILNIYSVNYLGSMSEEPLRLNVKTYRNYIDDINIDTESFIFKDGDYYTNNSRPCFQWSINDDKNLKYFAISLDGSNWIKIKDNKFIFSKSLKDGNYSFRVRAINKDDLEGQIKIFNFKLQTRNLSAPIYSRETMKLKPNIIEKLKIEWLKVNNIKNYQFVFNKNMILEKDEKFETIKESIDLIDYKEYVKIGINTISLRTIDYFGNFSAWNSFSFVVTNQEYEHLESIQSINFNLDSKPNDKFFTFEIPKLIGYPLKKIFLISPSEIDVEIIDVYESDKFTNKDEFNEDGVWKLEIQYFKEIDGKHVYSNTINYIEHIYNSYHFEFEKIRIENNIIKWDSSSNIKYNYYEYSICEKDSDYLNFNKTYGREINILNKLIDGKYKILIKSYSLNNIFCEEKEFNFEVTKESNFSIEKIIINQALQMKIKKYKKENYFKIISIIDKDEKEIKGVLLYKKVFEQYMQVYENNKPLSLNTNYNFTFNEVITNE